MKYAFIQSFNEYRKDYAMRYGIKGVKNFDYSYYYEQEGEIDE